MSIETEMKAWQLEVLGEPEDVLNLRKIQRPAPKANQVLVEVDAVGLGFGDLLFCRGQYQQATKLPYVPGTEMSGTIVEIGEGSRHKVGERVCALPSNNGGGLARFALADDSRTFSVTPDLSPTAASAFLIAFHTVWFSIKRRANLQPGEVLLVHSGAGGVGTAAIQLGKAMGARVIAVAGGEEKVALCSKIGADEVIDHTSSDFREVVNTLTEGRGADVILDPVNGEAFDKSRRCIAPEGRLVVVGFASGTISDMPSNHLLLKNYTVMGMVLPYYLDNHPELVQEAHDEMLRLASRKQVEPVVQRIVPFEEAPSAIAALSARETWGRTVVTGMR